ncbi:M20/M25/M40 family metallo-hydrolase [Exiguobacterium sp. TNDT2]|uniref:M20/M25/M40 family metallo-hydrolase n=1 Tax=Exiguobacterium sp. TNDT2 TaxID=2233531 RepID=UPI000DF00D1C|nr:M20/M25/M40 family metallo-hydrolase [Exiguobacterium sp. TNDT2]
MNQIEQLARHGLKTASEETEWLKRMSGDVEQQLHGQPDATDEDIMEWLRMTSDNLNGNEMGGERLFQPETEALPYHVFDPYIRGIVRWMNELGMLTQACCDGHGKRPAHVFTLEPLTKNQRHVLRETVPADSTIRLRFGRREVYFEYVGEEERRGLLDIATNLFHLTLKGTYEQRLNEMERCAIQKQLMAWLNVPGESGKEGRVRHRLALQLKRLTDTQYVDERGNLLAILSKGQGPVVLLSAHMDTVARIERGRDIIQNGTVLKSSHGILGADDRAGIVVILECLERLSKMDFQGTVKVAFTVDEEIGCLGAREIDRRFIHDVDYAIVADRRGSRDIVTGCRGVIDFCDESYGQSFEQAGRLAGMSDWTATRYGGSSDAKVFAEFGIPSVNLSVGYQHEHTDQEEVDVQATLDTIRLLVAWFHHRLFN